MLPAEDAHFRVRLWHGLAIELRSGLCEGWGNETRPDVLVVDDYPEIATSSSEPSSVPRVRSAEEKASLLSTQRCLIEGLTRAARSLALRAKGTDALGTRSVWWSPDRPFATFWQSSSAGRRVPLSIVVS